MCMRLRTTILAFITLILVYGPIGPTLHAMSPPPESSARAPRAAYAAHAARLLAQFGAAGGRRDLEILSRLTHIASPSTARRLDAPQTTLQVFLYTNVLGVKSAAAEIPHVNVFDGAGELRAVGQAGGPRSGDGQWLVGLQRVDDPQQAAFLKPGDRVEATVGSVVTTVMAPAMRATGDAAHDLVRGQVPVWAKLVYVQMYVDQVWVGQVAQPGPTGSLTGADGGFEVDLTGKSGAAAFDLRPGTWGQAVVNDADGNLFAVAFAPPAVIAFPGAYATILMADPDSRPEILVHNDLGAELFHSQLSQPLPGQLTPRFLIPFIQGNSLDTPFELLPGHEVELWQGGRQSLSDTVPWVTASLDAATRTVTGLAPAGTVVNAAAYLYGNTAGGEMPAAAASAHTRPDGTYQAAFPALAVRPETTVTTVAYPDPLNPPAESAAPARSNSVAYAAMGRVPAQNVILYGNVITGTIAGWGSLDITQRDADGTVLAKKHSQTDSAGSFDERLFTPKSESAAFRPGQQIVLTPEIGSPQTITVPAVTAESDGQVLVGTAPAGAMLTTTAYPMDPNQFSPMAYDADYQVVTGRAGADGRFALRCPAGLAGCGLRFGQLTATTGTASFVLAWQVGSFAGVGVTTNTIIGRATAGLAITLTPLDHSGRPDGTPRTDFVRRYDLTSLPAWDSSLAEFFPNGPQTGDRLRVTVGANVHDVVIVPFTFHTDVATDSVSGSGVPGVMVVAQAMARTDEQNRGYGGGVATQVGPNGRWSAHFDHFNVKPGDDVNFFVVPGNYFLLWLDESVQGEEPPPSAPTPAPTAAPKPAPTRMPNPAQQLVYLPYVVAR